MTMRLTSFIFRTGIAVSVFTSILSCTRYEPGLEQALALAGDNRIEFEDSFSKIRTDEEFVYSLFINGKYSLVFTTDYYLIVCKQ